jgi:hypothetical protein
LALASKACGSNGSCSIFRPRLQLADACSTSAGSICTSDLGHRRGVQQRLQRLAFSRIDAFSPRSALARTSAHLRHVVRHAQLLGELGVQLGSQFPPHASRQREGGGFPGHPCR